MKNKKGFTLIELVIAIGLLSIFAITIGISLNRTLKSQKLKEQQEFVEKIKSAASSGKINDLLKNLGPKEAQKITNILSNKEATSKLLSTPKAQQLLKKFLGDK